MRNFLSLCVLTWNSRTNVKQCYGRSLTTSSSNPSYSTCTIPSCVMPVSPSHSSFLNITSLQQQRTTKKNFSSSSSREDGYVRNSTTTSNGVNAASTSSSPSSLQRKLMIDEMLRVDQAGEIAAVQIYAGQMWALRGTSPNVQGTLKEMKSGEERHVETINRLMAERRVRPSVLAPVWEAAGFALGAATALLGKEAAMACTVAVETAISAHYNDQIRTLLEKEAEANATNSTATTTSDGRELAEIFKKHRDEELEHHDTAIKEGATSAPFYGALSAVIQAGCYVAIAVAKKI